MVQLTSSPRASANGSSSTRSPGRCPTRVRRPVRPNGSGKTTLLRLLAASTSRTRGPSSSRRACGSLPAAGRPGPQRPHGSRGGVARLSAAAGSQGGDARHRIPPGRSGHPADEHEQMLARYSDVQDRFRIQDGYSMDLRSPRCSPASGSASPISRSPPTRFPAAGRCAWLSQAAARAPRSAPARRATNHLDSRRGTGSSRFWQPIPTASSSSPTTGSSSMPW